MGNSRLVWWFLSGLLLFGCDSYNTIALPKLEGVEIFLDSTMLLHEYKGDTATIFYKTSWAGDTIWQDSAKGTARIIRQSTDGTTQYLLNDRESTKKSLFEIDREGKHNALMQWQAVKKSDLGYLHRSLISSKSEWFLLYERLGNEVQLFKQPYISPYKVYEIKGSPIKIVANKMVLSYYVYDNNNVLKRSIQIESGKESSTIICDSTRSIYISDVDSVLFAETEGGRSASVTTYEQLNSYGNDTNIIIWDSDSTKVLATSLFNPSRWIYKWDDNYVCIVNLVDSVYELHRWRDVR